MKIKRIKGLIIGLVILIAVSFFPTYSVAEMVPFSVDPVLPSNQDEEVSSYISITTEDAFLKQDLDFILTNNTKNEQKVQMNVVNATTSPHGIVQYLGEEDENYRITEKAYEMSNYLTMENEGEIVLKPEEVKKVTVNYNVQGVEGTLLGGVTFNAHAGTEEIKSDEDGATFQIKNEVNLVIGVITTFPTEAETVFEVGEAFLDPMPAYYVVRLPLMLDAPYLKNDLSIEYTILKESERANELFKGDKLISFAPKTETNLMLPWEAEEIERDVPYIIEGTLTYLDEKGAEQVLEFEREFMYETEKVGIIETLRLKVPEVLEEKSWLWFVLALPIIGIIMGYLYRKRKSQYAYYSAHSSTPKVIKETDPLGREISRRSKNPNDLPFKHQYHYNRKSKEYTFHHTEILTHDEIVDDG